MIVKEFKKYLELFDDKMFIIDVIKGYLSTATNAEVEVALQSAFDRLKQLAWRDKCKCMSFEQQLQMTKSYLKGEMYTNEQTAREMLGKQIKNIEKVLEDE